MQDFMLYVGYLGSLLLALCALPLAYKSWKDGHSKGIDGYFLMLWTAGEILCLAYVSFLGDVPLFLNYFINIILISIVVKYKLKPRL